MFLSLVVVIIVGAMVFDVIFVGAVGTVDLFCVSVMFVVDSTIVKTAN